MILLSKVVGISWHQALQINDVVSTIGTLDSLDFSRAGHLDRLAIRLVNHFVDFEVELLSN